MTFKFLLSPHIICQHPVIASSSFFWCSKKNNYLKFMESLSMRRASIIKWIAQSEGKSSKWTKIKFKVVNWEKKMQRFSSSRVWKVQFFLLCNCSRYKLFSMKILMFSYSRENSWKLQKRNFQWRTAVKALNNTFLSSHRGSAIAKIVGVNAKNLPQYEGECYMMNERAFTSNNNNLYRSRNYVRLWGDDQRQKAHRDY